MIWTSSLAESCESDAVNRNRYTPAAENEAAVDNDDGFWNDTVPGPDTCDHVVVNAAGGDGSPSSLAVPASVADAGNVTD